MPSSDDDTSTLMSNPHEDVSRVAVYALSTPSLRIERPPFPPIRRSVTSGAGSCLRPADGPSHDLCRLQGLTVRVEPRTSMYLEGWATEQFLQ